MRFKLKGKLMTCRLGDEPRRHLDQAGARPSEARETLQVVLRGPVNILLQVLRGDAMISRFAPSFRLPLASLKIVQNDPGGR